MGGPARQDAPKAVEALKRLNVPYLVSLPLVFQTTEEWMDSELGLHPVQVALQVRLPASRFHLSGMQRRMLPCLATVWRQLPPCSAASAFATQLLGNPQQFVALNTRQRMCCKWLVTGCPAIGVATLFCRTHHLPSHCPTPDKPLLRIAQFVLMS